MDLNRETAMRLWNKAFGKETKAHDFAGRQIVKGAYNDRKSDYGWNVDHILPQSKGGVTADYNLICCHINTNDEKADKFPCFTANEKKFEIIKVQNHYEIRAIDNSTNETDDEEDDETDFFDYSSAIKLYKKFKGLQTKTRFVGTVEIILNGINGADTAITDFIETLFDKEDVQFAGGDEGYYTGTNVRMLVKNYEMPYKGDISELLDKCVLLNTYLSYYFVEIGAISDYSINYRVDGYKNRKEMFKYDSRVYFQYGNKLRINKLVIDNCSETKERFAKESLSDDYDVFYDYPYIYTELAKNLKKEVKGK